LKSVARAATEAATTVNHSGGGREKKIKRWKRNPRHRGGGSLEKEGVSLVPFREKEGETEPGNMTVESGFLPPIGGSRKTK